MTASCDATLSCPFYSRICKSPSICVCRAAGSAEAPFAAFGVFDGHGGKFAATHAAKHLLDRVMAVVDRGIPAPMQPPPSEGPSGDAAPEVTSPALQESSSQGPSPAAGPPAGVAGAGDTAVPKGASARVCALWRLQDELLERLPQVGPFADSLFDCIDFCGVPHQTGLHACTDCGAVHAGSTAKVRATHKGAFRVKRYIAWPV